MNSTSSAIVLVKPGLAALRGTQERDGGRYRSQIIRQFNSNWS